MDMDSPQTTQNNLAQDDEHNTATTAVTEEENGVFDKSQSLVDIANNTFRELCKSLESEQTKLLELEERRKQLQEEMLKLKAEIEEEKNIFHININQSVSDNLKVLNNASGSTVEINDLKDSFITENQDFDDDESNYIATARNTKLTLDEHSNDIKWKLQTILDQCKEGTEESTSSEIIIKTEENIVNDVNEEMISKCED